MRHVTHALILVLVAQLFELGTDVRIVTLFDGRQHMAVGPVAIDPVPGDQLAHQGQGLDSHLPDDSCRVHPYQALDLGLGRSDPVDGLGAAATRCAPPDGILLKEDDAIAALCQV